MNRHLSLALAALCAAAAFGGSLATAAAAAEPTAPAAPAARTAAPSASDYVERPEVLAYLKEVSASKGIPLEWLKDEVAVARYSPLTEKYMTPRPNANKKTTPDRNFALYKRNLINEERIARGVDFMNRNRDVLERIEKETGVSPYAVTAIIGIESIYGRNMGRFRVLDALMTLSFD